MYACGVAEIKELGGIRYVSIFRAATEGAAVGEVVGYTKPAHNATKSMVGVAVGIAVGIEVGILVGTVVIVAVVGVAVGECVAGLAVGSKVG